MRFQGLLERTSMLEDGNLQEQGQIQFISLLKRRCG